MQLFAAIKMYEGDFHSCLNNYSVYRNTLTERDAMKENKRSFTLFLNNSKDEENAVK